MPLQIVKGAIKKMKVDAIVNAASESLPGGGADGCIHRARSCYYIQLYCYMAKLHGRANIVDVENGKGNSEKAARPTIMSVVRPFDSHCLKASLKNIVVFNRR